jgi:hypothetical protein
MFAMIFNCFCKRFQMMFQVFRLSFLYIARIASDVSKIDRVLYMGCVWKREGAREQSPHGRR